jgi:hypothetical protein
MVSRTENAMRPGWTKMLAAGALSLAAMGFAPAPSRLPPIYIEDVQRFYKLYDSAHGHPTVAQLEQDYLVPGTDALHRFQKIRNVTAQRIFDENDKHPAVYTDARRCLAMLPKVKARTAVALDKLYRLYPEAKSAPITVLVGRGRPVGVTDDTGVYIGLEALCAADFMNPNPEDRFVHVMAHEYGHVQQSKALKDLNPGDPGATVLAISLGEGAADFIGKLISGDVGNQAVWNEAKGHEAAIEQAFVKDEDSTDLTHWLYNGDGTAQHPGDLGYWVGYRIVKAYWDHHADKRQALKDIIEMTDPKAFLAKSGWKPAGA